MRTILLCLLLLPEVVQAQWFNTFSGRNHPELDWVVAETPHFKIAYPRHLAGIEVAAAPIAEATYEALSKNLEVTFDEKIRIYLSDEDAIVNGFAVPIGNGYTDIWVHVLDVSGSWTGEEKWLRKVIAHELAHIFHFKATRSNLGLFGDVFGDPTPSFWTEGLAQYETERWEAQRGDRWLRTAVLDDQLSYEDGRSIWNGRLRYAVGNSQVRYFAEQYGDSTLAKLLKHRNRRFLGLVRAHNLYNAFPATIGKTYTAFYDDWRRHVNVYYNTLAGQLEPVDSLYAEPEKWPGQYVYDVKFSPDEQQIAVLSLAALVRPVRRLHLVPKDSTREARILAEGTIYAPVTWHPEGTKLAYAREVRGKYGSLVQDLFLVDVESGNEKRLTHSRRASSPSFSPDGTRLLFIGTQAGTSNLFLLDIESGEERQVTEFVGDVQLLNALWHPTAPKAAFSKFDEAGRRDLWLVDLESGVLTQLTDTEHDDRAPVWSTDGSKIAFTSLRDYVPNVFVLDVDTKKSERVTALALGADVLDWLQPDSMNATGQLVLNVPRSKTNDRAYRVPASRRASEPEMDLPEPYTGWTKHRPPAEIPAQIAPNPSLVGERYDYNAWRNLTHAVTFVVPYYGTAEDWGFGGTTFWTEPLGKHTFAFAGAISIPTPIENSWLSLSYSNNQFYPSLLFNLYRIPNTARPYGASYLVENLTGGDVTAAWPLDLTWRPFVTSSIAARIRYAKIEPLNDEDFSGFGLPVPEGVHQADLQFGFLATKQRPYRYNVIHPLDGKGVRLLTTGGFIQEGKRFFVRPDLALYAVFPGGGTNRIFAYGRGQVQLGTPRAQDFIGFSRRDMIQLPFPGLLPVTLGDVERVRGYRAPALGDRVLFGTLEYRALLVPDLETRLFGLIELRALGLTAFADGGLVWTGNTVADGVERLGLGVEFKNVVALAGFEFLHAVGFAQPASHLGDLTEGRYEIYYRVRTSFPF